MTWLAIQLWFLLLGAFVVGAVVAYVVLRQLVPDVNTIQTHADPHRGGEH